MSTADTLNQGWQYHQAGDLARAEALYREALRLNPADANGWFLLGLACRGRGALADAEAGYREAVRLRPDFFEALNNLGNVLAIQGRPEEAADCYCRVLHLRPDHVEAHNNLGAALRHLGDLAGSEASYREALRRRPNYPDALNNLGDVLSRQGRLDDAVACYREALRLRPDYPEAHSNLAVALRQQGKFDEAVASFRDALRCRPNYAEVYYNLGMAYWENGRPREAADCYRQALTVRPDYAEALFYLGQALHALGRRDEAVATYRRLLETDPGNNAEGHLGRALARLILGDYEQGWAEYEWRWRSGDFARPPARAPRWDGSPLDGRTILLQAEQGLGETLQFVRYAALVKRRGGTVVFACPRPLLGLLAACPGIDRLVPADGEPPPCDVQVSLLSLPGIFGTTLAAVPAEVPYLAADPALVARWRWELAGRGGRPPGLPKDEGRPGGLPPPPFPGLRVGLAWQGNTRYRLDRYRSVPLRYFAPLARVPGVRLFSLQKGPGSEQLRDLPADCPVIDLGPRLDEHSGPFLDTAAVMKNLDLVIAVDTAVAHLAGGLGVPVWVVLSAATDWRWLLERADSPWYPTARLFRQASWGDWEGVFTRMDQELRKVAAERRHVGPVLVEVAPGELLDKLSILEIKAERIRDVDKLRHVRQELRMLAAARDEALPASADLAALTAELKAVNEQLWDLSDEIRRCEAGRSFGACFIQLAREGYRTNDRRAALKRRINDLLGAHLVEEKSYAPYEQQK
jgi:tetratricopeptide (TPR) repeat protein